MQTTVQLILIKGAFAGEDAAQVAALTAMIGHCYPVWLKFNGGKGVATFLGILLALAWPAGIAACVIWLIAAGLTRMSSMGGLAAAAASGILAVLSGHGTAYLLCTVLTMIVFWRHRANITRIRAGTEPKLGQK